MDCSASPPPPPRGTAHQPSPPPLWLLALLTFSGTLGMHIFVPALTLAGRDLHASNAAMQMTISLYVLGLAAGQLIYGPLADRLGRRPVLMGGLAIYTLAGLAAVLASLSHHGATALIVARLCQALGGCSGMVLGRAIVRDTSAGESIARRMAYLNMMVMLPPALAPLAGSLIAAGLGWRAILAALLLLGVVNLTLAWRRLPESRPSAARGSTGQLARDYAQLLSSRRFLGYMLGGGCATTSIYAFIASAPFIFVQQLGRPEHEVGLYLTALVSGMWMGNALCSRVLGRVPLVRILMLGNSLSLACCALLLALALAGYAGMPAIVLLMFLFSLGSGGCSPAALTLTLNVNPAVAGSASGLYGSAQMAVGALCTALAGLGGASPLTMTALVLTGACLLSQAAFHTARRAPLDEKVV
ncbi:MAG: multidrug effflux MFS transporter [Desulfovibrionaceae bacterium]|nr:multidrug effflux MFS transporter [Desulfovibrionaceae bacterium]